MLAFVTPLRYVISLAVTSARAARLLGAAPFVAGLAAAWVLSLITATIVCLIAERWAATALATASVALPYALLWLVRGLTRRWRGRREPARAP